MTLIPVIQFEQYRIIPHKAVPVELWGFVFRKVLIENHKYPSLCLIYCPDINRATPVPKAALEAVHN